MNKKLVQVIEGTISLAIVASLYLVGVYVKPKEKIIHLDHPSVELRDRFLGVAAPVDKPGTLWMVGKEGKILRSEDGGKAWHVQDSGSRENLQSIAAWDSQRAVAVGNTGLILVTADGGKTWKPATAPKSDIDNKLLRVRIDPQGTAWAVGVMGAVLTSKDFGYTWERNIPEQDVAWNDIAFPAEGSVWLVGEFGHAMHTAAPGSKPVAVKAAAATPAPSDAMGDIEEGKKLVPPPGWVGVKMPTDRSLMTILFSDPQHATAGGVEGTLLTTSDGGATWNQVPLATKEHILDLTFADNRWIGVGGRGLLIVGDAARTAWQVGRVKADDYAWHAAIAPFQDKLLIAGATLLEQNLKDPKVYTGN
jgi:photosystem II stability/assembly factor-like uncharacterized protein